MGGHSWSAGAGTQVCACVDMPTGWGPSKPEIYTSGLPWILTSKVVLQCEKDEYLRHLERHRWKVGGGPGGSLHSEGLASCRMKAERRGQPGRGRLTQPVVEV